ncbi:hypothetical protein HK101_004424 [Irineochytrium annulatum]|nr:hypothetical protein HK101_004424 [Irineochytrium annulatum]
MADVDVAADASAGDYFNDDFEAHDETHDASPHHDGFGAYAPGEVDPEHDAAGGVDAGPDASDAAPDATGDFDANNLSGVKHDDAAVCPEDDENERSHELAHSEVCAPSSATAASTVAPPPSTKAKKPVYDRYAHRRHHSMHPVSNRYLAMKWDEQDKHTQHSRLAHVSHSINNSAPPVYLHLRQHLKRHQQEEELRQTILRQNRMMDERIRHLVKNFNSLGARREVVDRRLKLVSLGMEEQRRLRENRIRRENDVILGRLEATQPYYGTRSWHDSELTRLEFLKNHAAFPQHCKLLVLGCFFILNVKSTDADLQKKLKTSWAGTRTQGAKKDGAAKQQSRSSEPRPAEAAAEIKVTEEPQQRAEATEETTAVDHSAFEHHEDEGHASDAIDHEPFEKRVSVAQTNSKRVSVAQQNSKRASVAQQNSTMELIGVESEPAPTDANVELTGAEMEAVRQSEAESERILQAAPEAVPEVDIHDATMESAEPAMEPEFVEASEQPVPVEDAHSAEVEIEISDSPLPPIPPEDAVSIKREDSPIATPPVLGKDDHSGFFDQEIADS